MTDNETPPLTIAELRERYIDSDTMLSEDADRQYAEFDRALASHDADIAAQARVEGATEALERVRRAETRWRTATNPQFRDINFRAEVLAILRDLRPAAALRGEGK